MTTIACVLRSGGDYGVHHVARLRAQVTAHAAGAEFLCLTDMPEVLCEADRTVGIQHRWPGWFSKIELLRRPGPLLYLDLDVTVIGDLAPLLAVAERHEMVMCRGFWGPDDPNPFNSSVMAWCGSAPLAIYELMAANQDAMMRECKSRACWGDQGLINRYCPVGIEAWQALLPGSVVSFKRGALMGESLDGCAVVVSHGQPRPWLAGAADARLKAWGFTVCTS